MHDILTRIAGAIERGDDHRAHALVTEAIASVLAPREVLDAGLIAGMDVVGAQFCNGDIFLPDVLLAARAMYAALDVLKPLLAHDGVPSAGRVVLGTVEGDLHDIGKNLA